MLRKTSELFNYVLGATDGKIGHLKDFYFEDQTWTIRYLIADTGNWLMGRQVLLSPFALESIQDQERVVRFNLSVKQIEGSPSIDVDRPVTRQHESDYALYYGWPMYWYGPVLWGPTPFPIFDRNSPGSEPLPALPPEQTANPHLRSVNEVTGYHIQAQDGELGHVDDFIFDPADWAIRYIAINTRSWWAGKKLLIFPDSIAEIDWAQAKAKINWPRERLRQAPEYYPSQPLSRDYEASLCRYYQRAPYWEREHRAAA